MAPNKKIDFLQVGYVNGEFVTSTLFASFIPIFPCVDTESKPYSEYGSGSTKILNRCGSNLGLELRLVRVVRNWFSSLSSQQ